MKLVTRYQSQLLVRKSYKPNRLLRAQPAPKPGFAFRAVRRFGAKPRLEPVT